MSILQCPACQMWYDSRFRNYVCSHDPFPVRDEKGSLEYHSEAYLSEYPPKGLELQGVGRPFESLDEMLDALGGWGVLICLFKSLGGRLEALPPQVTQRLGMLMKEEKEKRAKGPQSKGEIIR
jgi:hypothetical protein